MITFVHCYYSVASVGGCNTTLNGVKVRRCLTILIVVTAPLLDSGKTNPKP